ncbi:phage tail protein [Spartinivicinus poritis]|uniref:Phage tail protein n=1 Tax=Spartinivicinus poritis TaxID=2994640 RepID=A0ABT5UEI1_9GAMM|nr:phage tail protein [Spartinivicinus sp. A2-2]MDE1464780.1 phage tail protein [Spartinivicinus sp. A2-2]
MINDIPNQVMMALGDFMFSVSTVQYQTLKTSQSWRWAKKDRYGRKPAKQFHGPDANTKKLDIAVYPEIKQDFYWFDKLKQLADKGEPLRLVGGSPSGGVDLGLWVIDQIDQDDNYFFEDGTPMEIKGSLAISEYGEDI